MLYVIGDSMQMDGYGCSFVFFFNDTATTEIYTLSLHDALPICLVAYIFVFFCPENLWSTTYHIRFYDVDTEVLDQRSEEHTSELQSRETISYAVFCLKKKKNIHTHTLTYLNEQIIYILLSYCLFIPSYTIYL